MEDIVKWYPVEVMGRKEINDADKVFCLLLWCGFSQTMAYRYAFGSNGSANSISSMASKKASEPQIKKFFFNLAQVSRWNAGETKAFRFKYLGNDE